MTRASRRKHHIIYKTTCMTTGKFYIGLHSTDDLGDTYLGSGTHLRRSIKKHGLVAHVREILEQHPTRKIAGDREREIVNTDLIKDPLCMNIIPGGTGVVDRPISTDSTRAKMSATHRKNNADPLWKERRWAGHREKMNADKVRVANMVAQREAQNRPEIKAQRSRPCTVDGQTIYHSIKELAQALGRGKFGTRSPTFSFIEPNGPVRNTVALLSAWADPVKKASRLLKRQQTLTEKRMLQQGT